MVAHSHSSSRVLPVVAPAKKLKLLYVGRDNEFSAILRDSQACTLTQVENSLLAIQLIRPHHYPDAIICEYQLAGQTGTFLFEQLRQNPAFDHIPFILLAPQFNKELYDLAFSKGMDDFFAKTSTKPVKILSRVSYLCNLKKRTELREIIRPAAEIYHMPVSKRIFDIAVASIALLIASPVLLLVIAAIRIESKGKIYYTSKRVGRKVFDFYKLRSMRTGADEELKKLAKEKNQYESTKPATIDFDSPCHRCSQLQDDNTCSPLMFVDKNSICEYWYNTQKRELDNNKSAFVKIKDDPRVTRVGKFIRNTSIDELPQLINVLKGDMSIVGNRPLPVYEAELLTVDALSKRFLAPAGITGLWQVRLRGKGGVMSQEERKSLDNEYADHFKSGKYSFWYDMKLILQTIPAMFQKSSV